MTNPKDVLEAIRDWVFDMIGDVKFDEKKNFLREFQFDELDVIEMVTDLEDELDILIPDGSFPDDGDMTVESLVSLCCGEIDRISPVKATAK